jgi:site-specific recombinase XerD
VHADQIILEDINENIILDFLDYLEKERASLPITRNQRLGAIKTFFRFIAAMEPEMLRICENICAISLKKTEKKVIVSMTQQEVEAIINSPDGNSVSDLRDKAMLMLMYNTGARVQEIADISITDLNLGKAPQVLLTGKGRKQRIVPLWVETVDALNAYIGIRQQSACRAEALFLNSKKQRIGRFGIDYIVKKHKKNAEKQCPSLTEIKISPHIFRHTTALLLIQSGVDIVIVKEWLGHADIKTTCSYLEINIEMKREALAKCPAPKTENTVTTPQWQQPGIIDFLKSLSCSSSAALC